MRFILSCLLLTFLTACQTAQMSSLDLSAAAKFPSEKWSSQTLGSNVTYFACPEERCGEKIGVLVMQKNASGYAGISLEEMLRMKSVNDAFIKEMIGLAQTSSNWNRQLEVKTVRKINGEPVGIYAEGTAASEAKGAFFAVEERVKGNRVITAIAVAPSLKTAQSSLRLVHLPALLK